MEEVREPVSVPVSAGMKCLRWLVFLPVGWLGGILAGVLIWLPFAAPYLLFHKFAGFAIFGFVASYATYVYVFLKLSWLIAPTKSKVEAWVILIVACLISANLLIGGASIFKHIGAPLFGAIIGCVHVIRFYFSACRGKHEFE